jgi:hypothetical protein
MIKLIEEDRTPDSLLGQIVGHKPARRTDLQRLLWKYINAHSAKDKTNTLGRKTTDPTLISLIGAHFQTTDVSKAIERHTIGAFLEDVVEVLNDPTLTETEKKQLATARVGQGKFREQLIKYWKACAATGCTKIEILTASHIKPWRQSSNAERLDPFNGLLLVPNLDAVFDKYLITFDENGKIKISSNLSKAEAKLLGVNPSIRIKLNAKHEKYMHHHRKIFSLT